MQLLHQVSVSQIQKPIKAWPKGRRVHSSAISDVSLRIVRLMLVPMSALTAEYTLLFVNALILLETLLGVIE